MNHDGSLTLLLSIGGSDHVASGEPQAGVAQCDDACRLAAGLGAHGERLGRRRGVAGGRRAGGRGAAAAGLPAPRLGPLPEARALLLDQEVIL